MASQQDTLEFLNHAAARGERTALIALTGVEGGAARGIGTLMGVSESGAWIGSLSGGCVEAALVGEAQLVIARGQPEMLRLGAGSPLIDIRLPCGTGIDLLIVPDPDGAMIADACKALGGRKPVTLSLARPDEPFTLTVPPRLRLIIAGHGEEVPALANLARTWGAEVLVLTPDERTAAASGGEAVLLKTPAAHPALTLDRWSALVMLFHDHDWEVPLLVQALEQQPLFIGAMGSRTTHKRRLAMLAETGVSAEAAARIKGPVGLIPAARDPQTMALSVLAEVVAAYNDAAFASRFAPR